MASLEQIYALLSSISARLNDIETNSKTTGEFPHQTSLIPESKVRVYHDQESKYVTIDQIIQSSGGSGGNNSGVTIISKNHVFISSVGDDQTAEIENESKPYATIDAAINAYIASNPRENNTIDHIHLIVSFLSSGVFLWNQIPERNIVIDSGLYNVEVDFSGSPNSTLHPTDGFPFNFILNGKYLTIKNHSENKINHDAMNLYGVCDVIDTQRTGFGGFSQSFISAKEIKIRYNFIKGYGNVFKTYGDTSFNEFLGDIDVSGHLCLNNQANGYSFIDFDYAKSTGKLMFLKNSLPGKIVRIDWGECKTGTSSNHTEGMATVYIDCKSGARCDGNFQGALYFSGKDLIAIRKLARMGYDVTITGLHLKTQNSIASTYSTSAKLTLIDSIVEISNASSILAIETNTNFTNEILHLKGNNTIIYTSDAGTDLISKYATASPTGVAYRQFTEGGLKTNGVLNTTLVGNNNTDATLIIDTTNTY